jgi:hypothetical protein
VFCEGESEEAYVKYLRSKYRLPVDIVAKIAGLHITAKYIANYKQGKPIDTQKDKTFLLYDLDVKDMFERLQKIKGTILLYSNPCFELWYLLHFHNQTTTLTSDDCLAKLANRIEGYRKGGLDENFKNKLSANQHEAIQRAKSLIEYTNPSTSVYKFIEALENVKNQDNSET